MRDVRPLVDTTVGEVDDVDVVVGCLLGDEKSRGGDGDFFLIVNPANWVRLRCRAAIASVGEHMQRVKEVMESSSNFNW